MSKLLWDLKEGQGLIVEYKFGVAVTSIPRCSENTSTRCFNIFYKTLTVEDGKGYIFKSYQ
jgi:hypothetical protein